MRLITYIFGCILLLSGFSLKAQERNLFKKKTEIEVKSNSQLFQEKNKKKEELDELPPLQFRNETESVGVTAGSEMQERKFEPIKVLNASISNFDTTSIDEGENLIVEIEEEAARLGWQALHEQLKCIDPESAARIHPNDPQRLSRALEVYRVSGQSMTALRQQQSAQSTEAAASGRQQLPYTVANLAIAPANRQVLHERIKQRFTNMLEQGFIDEVVALRKRSDLHSGLPSIRAVGYRQVWDYLDGKLTLAEMQERGIIATRQLAKRQFTWLRSWEDLHWLDSLDCDNLPRALKYLGTISILS